MTDYLNDPQFKNNASVRIFNERFEVEIPSMFLYSAEYLAVHNPHTNEDGDVDMDSAMRLTRVRLPIAGIVTHYSEGTRISFPNPKDTHVIYNIIMEHLNDWLRIVTTQYVNMIPPFVDLRYMEQLAEELHPYATQYNPAEANNTSRFGKLLIGGAGNLGRLKMSMYQNNVQASMVKQTGVRPNGFRTVVDRIYNAANPGRR